MFKARSGRKRNLFFIESMKKLETPKTDVQAKIKKPKISKWKKKNLKLNLGICKDEAEVESSQDEDCGCSA